MFLLSRITTYQTRYRSVLYTCRGRQLRCENSCLVHGKHIKGKRRQRKTAQRSCHPSTSHCTFYGSQEKWYVPSAVAGVLSVCERVAPTEQLSLSIIFEKRRDKYKINMGNARGTVVETNALPIAAINRNARARQCSRNAGRANICRASQLNRMYLLC